MIFEQIPKLDKIDSIYPNFRFDNSITIVHLWVKMLCTYLHFKELQESLEVRTYSSDDIQEDVSYEVQWRMCKKMMEEIEYIWKEEDKSKNES